MVSVSQRNNKYILLLSLTQQIYIIISYYSPEKNHLENTISITESM